MTKSFAQSTAETRPFWEGCVIGELRYQACAQCGQVQLIPHSTCANCFGKELIWKRASGRGRVLSHTTVHRAPTRAWQEKVPYVIALVALDEGFRLMVNVKDGTQVSIDQVVEIGFTEVGGQAMPQAEVPC